MHTLLIEIVACLFAAAFLSLFIGWAIRGSLAKREVETINAEWESKQSELELRYKQDTEQLEDQVHQLQTESQQMASQNENINESLRENEISVHKARADAIELNRQQADTQERLQRIIAQKDEELKHFRAAGAVGLAGSAGFSAANADETKAKIATLSAKREAWESERARLISGINDSGIGEDQATIAIDPADLPPETYSDQLDQTVRIDSAQLTSLNARKKTDRTIIDEDSDKTLTFEEDQTMLLDNIQRRPPTGRSTDDNDD